MATPAPTAAPPNFYENLPAGGDAASGGPAPKKPGGESDVDEEILKGLTGVYRVLSKMSKIKKDLKPGIDKLKDGIKELVVAGLKKDPKDLDSGDDKSEGAAPPPAEAGTPPPPPAPPSHTDETHSA